MGIVVGFLPFIAFAVLGGSGQVLLGLLAGLALAVVLMVRNRSAKLLEVGSAVLFAVLTLYAAFAPVPLGMHAAGLAVNAGLAAIVLLSLAVGRPFTLAYARERVPQALWDHPVFLATNRCITAVWAAAFVVMTAVSVVRLAAPAAPRTIADVVGYGALAAAVWFTRWYPKRVRARVRAASASQGAVL